MYSKIPYWKSICIIFVGGFCGTVVRYWLTSWIQLQTDNAWPYDILLVNITGAFLLAVLMTWAEAALWIGPGLRLFLGTGFLGAYTTFSSFMLGAHLLLQDYPSALLYMSISLGLGWLAILTGVALGKLVIPHRKKLLQENSE